MIVLAGNDDEWDIPFDTAYLAAMEGLKVSMGTNFGFKTDGDSKVSDTKTDEELEAEAEREKKQAEEEAREKAKQALFMSTGEWSDAEAVDL